MPSHERPNFTHPVFAEPVGSQDPAVFGTPHPSDGAAYAQV